MADFEPYNGLTRFGLALQGEDGLRAIEENKRQSALAQLARAMGGDIGNIAAADPELARNIILKRATQDPLDAAYKQAQIDHIRAQIQAAGQKQITPLSEIGKILFDQSTMPLTPQQQEILNQEILRKTNPEEQKLREEQKAAAPKMIEGKKQFSSALENLSSLYDALHKAGGDITADTGFIPGLSNAYNSVMSAAPFIAKITDPTANTIRSQIRAESRRLVPALMAATGMSSKSLDSNTELKSYLESIGDTGIAYEANKPILDRLEKTYGLSSAKESSIPYVADTADGIQLDIPAPGKLRSRQQAEQPKLTPELALQELKRRQAMRGQQ